MASLVTLKPGVSHPSLYLLLYTKARVKLTNIVGPTMWVDKS